MNFNMNELAKLCAIPAVSGHEYKLAEYISGLLSNFCDEVRTDSLGNVIAVVGKGNKKKIMLDAHIDEIGLMIKEIDECGFIRFIPIGGIDPSVLPASEVVIHGKESIHGVIGAKPPHLQAKDEQKSSCKLEDLYIDTGYSYDELTEIVTIGDVISFKPTPTELLNGCFSCKAIDNRIGVYIVMECIKRLSKERCNAEVIGLFSVQEEVGLRGAKTGGHTVDPDCAVIVDVTHGISPYTDDGFPLGSGVAIGVGPVLDDRLTKTFIEACKKHKIPHTIEVCAGGSGTSADAVQTVKKGIPCILASIPLRYMHSNVETLNMSDANAVLDAICAVISNGKEWSFLC